MLRLIHLSSALFQRLQKSAFYRMVRRWTVSSITPREATDSDRIAIARWFNANGDEKNALKRNPNATTWIAEYHGQLAGFVELVWHPPENFPYIGFWLCGLYVKSQYRGLGIGEKLSRVVINHAMCENASTLDLVVYNDNSMAIRLYQKLGFDFHIVPELEQILERELHSTGRRQLMMRKHLSNHTR